MKMQQSFIFPLYPTKNIYIYFILNFMPVCLFKSIPFIHLNSTQGLKKMYLISAPEKHLMQQLNEFFSHNLMS